MRRLDTVNGLTTYFEHDARAGQNILKHVQDVEPFIELNAVAAQQLDRRQSWWFIGRTPDSVHLQWQQECGHRVWSKEWMEYARSKLNSPEYRKFNPNKLRI